MYRSLLIISSVLVSTTQSAPALPVRSLASSRARKFALRAKNEKVRVIHGSGGGWSAEDDRRMMQPYWDAQDAGGTLLRIDTNSGVGGSDNATDEIIRKLNLEFQPVPGLVGSECPDGVINEETVQMIREAAGIWFGGGLPGRAVSCLFGYWAEPFGVNSDPEASSPVLTALREHPLVGGISAGAMMQPSAALIHGNEISARPVGYHESADIMRAGELMMNNRGAGLVLDQFTIHSHFSERGYQGMLPVALVQRSELDWAAGFDEGGVGHYFESNGDLFTVGVPDRGTGIVLYSNCVGDADTQECLLHFLSDGDVWNARTHQFDIDEERKVRCTGLGPVPDGSQCVFNRALADAQNFRRISKATAGAPPGTTVQNAHTSQNGFVVEAVFTATEETEAWCDDTGTVVSFTNLRLSQARNGPVPEKGAARCNNKDEIPFTAF